MRRVLATIFKVGGWVATFMWLGGALWILGWYDNWLDQYFLWRFVAHFIAFVTFPLVELAVIVEWIWHGWPHDVTVGFTVSLVGLLCRSIFFAAESAIERRVSEGSDSAGRKGSSFDASTVDGARRLKLIGVGAAIFNSSVTALAATLPIFFAETTFGTFDPVAYLDALIFAAIGFGVYKESRLAAVAGLLLCLVVQFINALRSGTPLTTFFGLVLVLCYVAGARGTYALHSLRRVQWIPNESVRATVDIGD